MADFFGDALANLLTDTLGGGNVFYVYEGDDTVDGSDGDDIINGGDGADSLLGGAGNDEIWGDWWNIPPALSGADFLSGGDGADTLYGGAGADTFSGGSGNDYILGDFVLEGVAGNDSIDGGDGDDFLDGEGGHDTLFGGLGDDELRGNSGDDWLVGGDGVDVLYGDLGGASGNDTLDGGAGGDALWGEDGNDTYLIDDLNDEIIDSGGTDTAIVSVSNYKLPGGIENVQYVNGAQALPNHIDALYQGSRWGLFGEPVTLAYGFLSEATAGATANGSSGFQAMGNAEKDLVRQALADWAAVSGLSFIEDPDPITVTTAGDVHLRFGMNSQPSSSGYAFYPTHGDVYIDYADGLNPGTISHEVGHALGLKHPFQGSVQLPDQEDSDQYTVMSYTGRSGTLFMNAIDLGGGNYDLDYFSVTPDTPQLYDIAAIQYLYGVNTATNAGNTNYSFLPTDEPLFEALWDAGGTDTISIAAFSTGGVIDLQEGRFSSIPILPDAFPPGYSGTTPTYNGRDNLAMTFGTVIENATGGSGNDRLSGNAVDNILDGGAGADIIAGGSGDDTYVVDHSGDQVMELGSSGNDSVQSAVAYDLMQAWHVENLSLTGGSAINGSGNWLDNVITGNGATNVLSGNRGNDTLAGGGGVDTLTGGSGADAFYFDAHGAPTADLVLDFLSGTDYLCLSLAMFSTLGTSGAVSAGRVQLGLFSQINAGSGNDGDGQDNLKYATDTGQLFYDSDGTGGTAHSLIATIYSAGTTPASLAFAPVDDIVMV